MRLEDRFRALELRREGKTYSEIRSVIPNLSKGTLCGWVKNIELTDDQKKRILARIKEGKDKSIAVQRQQGAWTNHRKMIERASAIIKKAQEETAELSKNSIFVPGVMLYWAEGDKSLNFQKVNFTNSDPLMIEFMMRWFREICQIPEKKFRIRLNIHTLHSEPEITKFWSDLSRIPLSQFNKSTIKPAVFTQKKNISYQGTCSISINDVSTFRRIMSWKVNILKKWGFDVSNAPVAQWIEQMFSKH